MKTFPDERGLLVILNSQQHALLLKQANSGDVYVEGLIARWRWLMQDLVTWERVNPVNNDDAKMYKQLQELTEEGKKGSCPCGQYHDNQNKLTETLLWALKKLS